MKRINISVLIFSLLLSLSINLKLLIDNSLDGFINNTSFNYLFLVKSLILWIIVYFVIILLFFLIDRIPLSNKKIELKKKKLLIMFICIFSTTMIYLLSHYPAVYLNDNLLMFYNPIDGKNPIIYGMFMSIVFLSLKSVFSSSITVFILSIIQSLISSIILTYIIVWFNGKVKNRILVLILFCYYAFVPIVSNYNMSLNKDTPFALLILLFFIMIFEIVETKGKILLDKKFIIKLIIISVLSIFIRRNGILVILLTLFIIFIIYGLRNYKKQFIISFLVIILFSGVELLALRFWGIEYKPVESCTIPIQQVSYLVSYHPNSLEENDYDLLSKIIKNPKENIKKQYNVYTIDDLKTSKVFDSNQFSKYKNKFLKLWIRKFPSNLLPYTKSYLLNNYDLWSINKLTENQSIFKKASTAYIDKDKQIHNKRILPKSIYNLLIKYYGIFNTYLNPAGCFVLLMITCLYAYIKERKNIIIISMPVIVLWFVLMLGVPMSNALRYMSSYLYILPIIILYTFKVTRENDKNEYKSSKRKFSK